MKKHPSKNTLASGGEVFCVFQSVVLFSDFTIVFGF